MRVLEDADALPFAGVAILAVEDAHAVLPGVVRHGEPFAMRTKTALVTRGHDVVELDVPDAVGDLLDRNIFLRRALRRGNTSERLHGGAVEHDADGEHAQRHERQGMDRVVDAIVRTRQRFHGVARQLASVDEIFAHRHHFPIELVALCPAIIIKARLRRLDETGDAHLAALEPIVLQGRSARCRSSQSGRPQ